MKVLICGEGAQDVGYFERWSFRTQEQITFPGWLQILLRKLLGENLEFVVVPRSRLISLPARVKEVRPAPQGHGKKAMIAKWRAVTDKCDMVVFMVDSDSNIEGDWSSKRDDIISGFNLCNINLRAVACVPMSASESWLLADGEAWKQLGLDDSSKLPKDPEGIWGIRSDPESNHPHNFFSRMCIEIGEADDRQTRVNIMELLDLNKLKEKCPISFNAFQEDLIGA